MARWLKFNSTPPFRVGGAIHTKLRNVGGKDGPENGSIRFEGAIMVALENARGKANAVN